MSLSLSLSLSPSLCLSLSLSLSVSLSVSLPLVFFFFFSFLFLLAKLLDRCFAVQVIWAKISASKCQFVSEESAATVDLTISSATTK